MRSYRVDKWCAICHQQIVKPRTSTKFCSQPCRAEAARRRAREWNEFHKHPHTKRPVVERTCQECGQLIPVTKRSNAIVCSEECTKVRRKRSFEKWTKANPDVYAEARRQHRHTVKALETRLEKRYGGVKGQYKEMWDAQDGRCAICNEEHPIVGKGRLAVDHDHHTGQIRGLLCAPCNLGLAHFRDSKTRLYAASAYLDKGAFILKKK